jgi:glutamyl-Q tRNA(Asp) synthetase
MTIPAFRFAPSPNGRLHLGHARSALVGYRLAQRFGGRFLVRIEDIDHERSQDRFVAEILDDLTWLGITWEQPVLRQSTAFDVYRAAAQSLEHHGLLYRCFATRAEIAVAANPDVRDPDGAVRYPGWDVVLPPAEQRRRADAGAPFALRLNLKRAADVLRAAGRWPLTYRAVEIDGSQQVVGCEPERWGDAVIVRKDVPTSYHLSVVVDDARQLITHVTRGEDLRAATDLQRVLQALLGLPEPLYHHHSLVLGPDGRKLSKSLGAMSLADLRRGGATAADIEQMIGPLPA